MNILIDKLPNKIDILGEEYIINSDFRVSILFELLMQDKTIEDEQKIIQALNLYYGKIPKDVDLAIKKILWFYSCGKEEKKGKKGISKRKNKQIYSFEYDSEYIYSAFLSQYNIDLESIDYLHWWKFRALFNSLDESNQFVKIMKYRAIDVSKIKDKEEKNFYKEMQEYYKIPISEEEEEKLDEITQALLNGTFNQNLL